MEVKKVNGCGMKRGRMLEKCRVVREGEGRRGAGERGELFKLGKSQGWG